VGGVLSAYGGVVDGADEYRFVGLDEHYMSFFLQRVCSQFFCSHTA
jgi:hypothetical protein